MSETLFSDDGQGSNVPQKVFVSFSSSNVQTSLWVCRCTEDLITSEDQNHLTRSLAVLSYCSFPFSYFWVSAENRPFPSNLHISSTASSFTPTTLLSSFTASTRLSAISAGAAKGQKLRWPRPTVPTAREAVKEPKTRALMDFRAAFSHCSTSAQRQ